MEAKPATVARVMNSQAELPPEPASPPVGGKAPAVGVDVFAPTVGVGVG